jgi:hypothetical protein
MTTAGEIADTISLLRSKIKVYETLKQNLQANYMPSDGGPAEIRIERKDGAVVTSTHLATVVNEFDEKIEELHEELREWEGLRFAPPSAEDAEEESEDEEEPEPAPVKKHQQKAQGKKNANPQVRGIGSNQSSSK